MWRHRARDKYMTSTFNTSLTVIQTNNTNPAVVRYRNTAIEVAYVVSAHGKINDFATAQYLCGILGIVLQIHGVHYPSVVLNVMDLVPIIEKLVAEKEFRLGNLTAAVVRNPASTTWELQTGWNAQGWLAMFDPAIHSGLIH